MKQLFSIVSILVITGMLVGVLGQAASTADVTATVTAQNISVTVSDGSISYGTVAVGSTASTTSSGIDDTQTATNNGNINQAFNIIGVDSGSWELGPTPGVDQYTHYFCNTNDCDGNVTWTEFNEDSYTTLSSTTVPASEFQLFDLRIELPSSSSVYTEQTVDVTVQAVSA